MMLGTSKPGATVMTFVATHIITVDGEEIPVMLIDGAAYTESEADAGTNADWEKRDDGQWLRNGQAVDGSSVRSAIDVVIGDTIGSDKSSSGGRVWYPVMTLDCKTRCIRLDTHLKDNSSSFAVFHNRSYEVALPNLQAATAKRILEEEFTPLFATMLAGYSCEWNGHDHIGNLDESAQGAYQKIRDLAGDCSSDVEVWDAEDWVERTRGELVKRCAAGEWPSVQALQDEIDDGEAQNAGDLLIVNGADKCAARIWAEAHEADEECA
jgi:hypothetical protein